MASDHYTGQVERFQMSRQPKTVETNRRPASPFEVGLEFRRGLYAPPSVSAAVAQLFGSEQ